jgi:N-acetylglucosamine malate deacetylase 1
MGSISRRNLLNRTSSLAAALVAGASGLLADEPLPSALNAPARRLKLMVAGGHPGDPEYGCGGTVARYTDLGHEAVLLYLNDGEPDTPGKPPKGPKGFRIAEARRACDILKARPLFAGQIDGAAVVDKAHYEAFRKIVEDEQPDVLLTQWPVDNHPDHRATSILSYDAWLRMGKKFAFYYYEVSNGEDTLMFSPTEYVDISGVEARKRAACYAHASQTPDKFYDLQSRVALFRGLESGHQQAEAYIRHPQSPHDLLPATPKAS